MGTKKSTTTPPIPFKFGNHPQNCTCPTCTRILNSLRSKPYVQALETALTSEQGGARRIAGLEARVLSLTGQLQQSKHDTGVIQRALEESRRHNQEMAKRTTALERTATHWNDKAEALAGEKIALAEENKRLGFESQARLEHGQELDAAKNSLWAELQGLRCELTTMVNEANLQRLGADQARREAGEAKAALKLAQGSLASATEKNTTLIQERAALQLQVQELTRFLPAWARWLFELVIACIIAFAAHQAGFQAGQVAGGSYQAPQGGLR